MSEVLLCNNALYTVYTCATSIAALPPPKTFHC